MTTIGCWRFTGTPAQNGVVTVGINETTPLLPYTLFGEFTKPSEGRISETRLVMHPTLQCVHGFWCGGRLLFPLSVSADSNPRLHMFCIIKLLCFKHIWGDYNPRLYVVFIYCVKYLCLVFFNTNTWRKAYCTIAVHLAYVTLVTCALYIV